MIKVDFKDKSFRLLPEEIKVISHLTYLIRRDKSFSTNMLVKKDNPNAENLISLSKNYQSSSAFRQPMTKNVKKLEKTLVNTENNVKIIKK